MTFTRIASSLLVASAVFVGSAPIASAQPEPLPACQFEDGNPDGLPCMWTSPRTGLAYYNDGSNYRD